MKQILVLGAGKSAPYLIRYLLDNAERGGWFVTVGDLDIEQARAAVRDHPSGDAIAFDVNDAALRDAQIGRSDVVVNMLAPPFQPMVAWDCVSRGSHMVSASYESAEIRDINADALRRNVLILTEMGLDPGIDHMSALALVHRLRDEGARITGFLSYGAGLPAPSETLNPLKYVITWNPRNVVMAGAAGAQYLQNGKIKIVPYRRLFHQTWDVEIDGVGMLEAYPNRDSLTYMDHFGLPEVDTMVRGTLRYPGWSETWEKLVRIGLPNETLRIPKLRERSYREVLEMFLPLVGTVSSIEKRVARALDVSPTGRIMENLRWLGLFSDERVTCKGDTAAAMLTDLIERKLPLLPDQRDMVILHHVVDFDRGNGAERLESTMVEYGEPGGMTAMSRTVGLPAALAVETLLSGELALTGCHIPTHRAIYEPILAKLAACGISFTERAVPPPPAH